MLLRSFAWVITIWASHAGRPRVVVSHTQSGAKRFVKTPDKTGFEAKITFKLLTYV